MKEKSSKAKELGPGIANYIDSIYNFGLAQCWMPKEERLPRICPTSL